MKHNKLRNKAPRFHPDGRKIDRAVEKGCARCKLVKLLAEFYGKSSYCKRCDCDRTLVRQRGAGRKVQNARMAVYYATHKDDPVFQLHHAARVAVHLAEAKGTIIRPKLCEACNKRRKVEGHHHKGYAKEFWLSVQWLCKPCHTAADRRDNAVRDDTTLCAAE